MSDDNSCKCIIQPKLSIKAEHPHGDQDYGYDKGHDHKGLGSAPDPRSGAMQAIGTK